MGKYISSERIRDLYNSGAISSDDVESLVIAGNPIYWSETYLKNPEERTETFYMWDHQREILGCENRLIAARLGRQTGKTITLVAKALWEAFTEPKIQVLIVAPWKENLKTIWEKLKSMIADTFVEESIAYMNNSRDVFEIEFDNGSTISGYAVNKYPDKIRGKSPHAVFIDEADYVAAPAIKTIIGFIISHPDVKIWASSTPSGARAWFYKVCYDPSYSHFHYPSWVNPNWGPEMEEMIRATLTSDLDWVHEVEAEFGELEQGVFKNNRLDICIMRGEMEGGSAKWKLRNQVYNTYSYKDLEVPREDCEYIFGIDWNGRHAGVQILVLEVEFPTNGYPRLMIVDRKSIHDSEATQTRALETIIAMYKKYRPKSIALDEGFGHAQLEFLRLWAKEHSTSGMGDRLKPIRWGDTIKIIDPFTKEVKKKSVKHFMIDNAVRITEADDLHLILPALEDSERTQGLVWQMRNFRIKDYTPDGKAIYTKGNDHILSCLLMCLYQYSLDYSNILNLGKVSFQRHVSVMKSPFEKTAYQDAIVDRLTINEPSNVSGVVDGLRNHTNDSRFAATAAQSGFRVSPFTDDERPGIKNKIDIRRGGKKSIIAFGKKKNRTKTVVRRRLDI